MPKGDIILIPFPYTDLSGSKLRPALVLAETPLDITLSFITTQIQWREPDDILLQPNVTNGIKKPSLIRLSKLATIFKKLIRGYLGSINNIQIAELNKKLIAIFQIV
jgi:mRNA interferase MazF